MDTPCDQLPPPSCIIMWYIPASAALDGQASPTDSVAGTAGAAAATSGQCPRGGLSPLYSAIALASFSGSRSSAPEAFRVTLFMKWYVGQFAVVPLPDVSNPEVH